MSDVKKLSEVEELNEIGGSKLLLNNNGKFGQISFENLKILNGKDGVNGVDGREIELFIEGTNLCSRYVGEENVNVLIDLSTIVGSKIEDLSNKILELEKTVESLKGTVVEDSESKSE